MCARVQKHTVSAMHDRDAPASSSTSPPPPFGYILAAPPLRVVDAIDIEAVENTVVPIDGVGDYVDIGEFRPPSPHLYAVSEDDVVHAASTAIVVTAEQWRSVRHTHACFSSEALIGTGCFQLDAVSVLAPGGVEGARERWRVPQLRRCIWAVRFKVRSGCGQSECDMGEHFLWPIAPRIAFAIRNGIRLLAPPANTQHPLRGKYIEPTHHFFDPADYPGVHRVDQLPDWSFGERAMLFSVWPAPWPSVDVTRYLPGIDVAPWQVQCVADAGGMPSRPHCFQRLGAKPRRVLGVRSAPPQAVVDACERDVCTPPSCQGALARISEDLLGAIVAPFVSSCDESSRRTLFSLRCVSRGLRDAVDAQSAAMVRQLGDDLTRVVAPRTTPETALKVAQTLLLSGVPAMQLVYEALRATQKGENGDFGGFLTLMRLRTGRHPWARVK